MQWEMDQSQATKEPATRAQCWPTAKPASSVPCAEGNKWVPFFVCGQVQVLLHTVTEGGEAEGNDHASYPIKETAGTPSQGRMRIRQRPSTRTPPPTNPCLSTQEEEAYAA